MVVKTLVDEAALSEVLPDSVNLPLPLKTVYHEFPSLCKVIFKRDDKLEAHNEIITKNPTFRK